MSPLPSPRSTGPLTVLRASIGMLRYPFLALGRRAEPTYFEGYDRGARFFLKVSTNRPDLGRATIADGDVLIYLVTQVANQLNLGEALCGDFLLRPASVLRALGRDRGGRQHELLAASIARLATTQVNTNLRHGPQSDLFNLLTYIDDQGYDCDDPDDVWRVRLPAFFVDEVRSRLIVQFNPSALNLRGLERRLYEWARVWAGGKAYSTYKIDLERAYNCAGSQDARRKFRHVVKQIVARDRLPGFHLELEGAEQRPTLVFTRLSTTISASEPSLASERAPIEVAFVLSELGLELPEPAAPSTACGTGEPKRYRYLEDGTAVFQ